MSTEVSTQVPELKKIEAENKEVIFKDWFFWVVVVFLAVTIAPFYILMFSETPTYELSKVTHMSKQQIINKFGKPSSVAGDDKSGYTYYYNSGFMISGTNKCANTIQLSANLFKKESDNYSVKLADTTLGSSYNDAIKRLGSPNRSETGYGKKSAIYLVDNNYILLLSCDCKSDKISSISYATYDSSLLNLRLDISFLAGVKTATETNISKKFKIIDKSTAGFETYYFINGFTLVVDNQNNAVKKVYINQDSIYNIQNVRVGDTLEKANNELGKPITSHEGVKNTTIYVYRLKDALLGNLHVTLSIDTSSKKIGYIEVAAA